MNHYYLAEGAKRNNLGDIIQGISARAFLNDNAICIDREKLDVFQGEEGILIANGWFMHNYSAFPPTKNLIPLYISFHLASIKLLLKKENRIHFRQNGPVGCRDRKTQLLFLLNGIPAFYSGCLTLAFNKKFSSPKQSKKGKIIMVDNVDHKFPEDIIKHIVNISGKELVFFNHDPIEISTNYDTYLELNEAYINKLMEEYLSADLVITNKLHCALPCLSLGIKVIFIHPNPNDSRLNIVNKLIPIYAYSHILKLNEIPTFLINQKKLKQIQYKLERLTKSFVEKSINPIKNANSTRDIFEKYTIYILAFLFGPFGYFIRKYKSN